MKSHSHGVPGTENKWSVTGVWVTGIQTVTWKDFRAAGWFDVTNHFAFYKELGKEVEA